LEPEVESEPTAEPEYAIEREPVTVEQVEPPVESAVAAVVEPMVEEVVASDAESEVAAAVAPAVTPEVSAESEPEAETCVDESPCEQPAVAQVEAATVDPEAFGAGLQVDHFAWPAACCRLISAAHDELDRLAVELKQLAGQGRAVAVASPSRGTGATSVLLCVAQRLALAGIGTVAVDGDLSHPQLGEMLGLKPECGWEEVLAGREPLDEVLIESVDDRMVVLPLVKPVPPSRELPGRVAQSLATLCQHFETVLWNMGPADDWWVLGDLVDRRLAEQIGLLLVVADSRQGDDQLQRICRKAAAAGIEQVVVVENFAGPQPSAA